MKIKPIIIRILVYSVGAISIQIYGIYLYENSIIELTGILDIVLLPVLFLNTILLIDLIFNILKQKRVKK